MQNRYGIHSGDVRLKSQGDSGLLQFIKISWMTKSVTLV